MLAKTLSYVSAPFDSFMRGLAKIYSRDRDLLSICLYLSLLSVFFFVSFTFRQVVAKNKDMTPKDMQKIYILSAEVAKASRNNCQAGRALSQTRTRKQTKQRS